MADLRFLDFVLIPCPVRKETQFKLPEDFSEFDFTDSLMELPFCVRFSRAFSSFHIAGRPLFGDPHLKCFTRRGRSKKIQHFRSQRQKSSLTSRCYVKGKIIGGIEVFLASKASILSTNYCLTFGQSPPCLFLRKVVYLIRRIKITNPRFHFFAQLMDFLFSSIFPQPDLLDQPIRIEAITDF